MRDTVIISGFPGIGKSHLYQASPRCVMDSDSSGFNKSEFPDNYVSHIEHLLEANPKEKIILVSSHSLVREELRKRKVKFVLVYPKRHLKETYLERYRQRGSSPEFVEMMSDKWDSFIDSCEVNPGNITISLENSNEYLIDIFTYMFWMNEEFW